MTERQVALRTGIGVALVIFVLGLVATLLNVLYALIYASDGGAQVASILGVAIVHDALHAVLLGAGVLVSLALIRPVAQGSGLGHIAGRGIIAAAIGVAAYIVIDTLYTLLLSLSTSGGFFGYAFPQISSSLSPGQQVLSAFFDGLGSFATDLPVVLLVLLVVARHWRDHNPGREAVE